MTAPRVIPLTAIPVGVDSGDRRHGHRAGRRRADCRREHDFEGLARQARRQGRPDHPCPNDGSEPGEAPFKRLNNEDISKLDKYREPDYDPSSVNRIVKRVGFETKLDAFLKAERAVAWARHGVPRRQAGARRGAVASAPARTPSMPGLEIAAEDYSRLARLAKVGATPTLEINTAVQYDDSDPNAYNILAEIPGSAGGTEYVMGGAHLDSWVAGDGRRRQRAAGSAGGDGGPRGSCPRSGVKPKRTIRFSRLWVGEEQGLLGSMAYVEKYLATRAPASGAEDPDRELLSGGAIASRSRAAWLQGTLVAYFQHRQTARAGSTASTARATSPRRRCSRSGCSRSPAWARTASWPRRPAAPITCSCRRSGSRATSSSRIRSTTTRGFHHSSHRHVRPPQGRRPAPGLGRARRPAVRGGQQRQDPAAHAAADRGHGDHPFKYDDPEDN